MPFTGFDLSELDQQKMDPANSKEPADSLPLRGKPKPALTLASVQTR